MYIMGNSYRVVSEVRQHGQWVDLPDGARNVTVEALGENGRVRVTYLKPSEKVVVGEPEEEPTRHTYVE
jgi:hypothetical protein